MSLFSSAVTASFAGDTSADEEEVGECDGCSETAALAAVDTGCGILETSDTGTTAGSPHSTSRLWAVALKSF